MYGEIFALYPPLRDKDQPSWTLDFAHPFSDKTFGQSSSATPANSMTCTFYQSVLATVGVEFGIIAQVFEVDEDEEYDEIASLRKLWLLEKDFLQKAQARIGDPTSREPLESLLQRMCILFTGHLTGPAARR